MKKILITGKNSYIGTSFEKYIDSNFSNQYIVKTVDMIGECWKNQSFSDYDVIYHVAGIAHSDNGKISEEKEKLYRAVNTDLTIEVAKKAKREGVKQFIFMSSSIVYGASAPIGKTKIINKETPLAPENCYGDSKRKAEEGIRDLEDNNFKVVILRPPMIYGEGCKGNFPKLEKMAKVLPIFPEISNKRTMLYIGNLVEFVRQIIENEESGIFWPCNKENTSTSTVVKMIAQSNGKKIILTKCFNPFVKALALFTPLVNKAFGDFQYSEEMGKYDFEYQLYSLEESIKTIENKD